jgi:hypothetical protein
MHDRHAERLRRLHRRHDVLEDQVGVHGADCGDLRGLVVDDDQRGVLRGEQVVGERIADRSYG